MHTVSQVPEKRPRVENFEEETNELFPIDDFNGSTAATDNHVVDPYVVSIASNAASAAKANIVEGWAAKANKTCKPANSHLSSGNLNCCASFLDKLKTFESKPMDELKIFGQLVEVKMRRLKNPSSAQVAILNLLNEQELEEKKTES